MDFTDGGTGIMGVYAGPDIKENGLVLALDAGNYKSFKGVPATNLLYSLTDTYGTINNADFKTSYGTETEYIPTLGYKTVRYFNLYNDGSVQCCPNPFRYGGNAIAKIITVSPSTTYTYEIIYKVASGYTHPNYMYRYEFDSIIYVTEAGVHSNSNRTSLGDGWYHAWGQFTTASTTNNIHLAAMFYYQYNVYDKVSVAAASLHQGTYIIPPEHMLLAQENRGTTVATGGGWADTIGNSNNGTLTNGPTYNSANGGSLVFDGSNDFVLTSSVATYGNNTTWEAWIYCTANVSEFNMFMGRYLPYFGFEGGNSFIFSNVIGGSQCTIYTPTNLSYNTWYHATFTTSYDGVNTTMRTYTNGIETASGTFSGVQGNYSNKFMIGDGNNSGDSSWYPFQGRISNTKVYNRALTAQEIQQNFIATRSRFSI